MSQFSSALQRSRKSVMASGTILVLTALAFTIPGALNGENQNGNNAYARNKEYSYGANHHSSRAYSIGLWGDLPYSAEQAAVLPNLIADMNSQDLAFTAHDGDLRQGSGSPNCADNSIFTNAAGYFASLQAPAIFTPGDNDWTDCDRLSLGVNGRNSLQELDHERAFFFNTPFTMGQARFLQEVQATPLCKGFASANGNSGPGSDITKTQTATYTDVPCVENRRWIVGRVVYATIDIQGSCNNLCDDYPDPVEYAARNAPGIQWMKDTFTTAAEQDCVAVMFITQG